MATSFRNFTVTKNQLRVDPNWKVGFVVSEWNEIITKQLFLGAQQTLIQLGIAEQNILKMDVPGSFELVYGAKELLKTKNYDAVIVIGSLIKGETDHFHYISSAVSEGIKDLNIRYDIPTIFCVLTDNTEQQSKDRSGGKYGNKGEEAAVAALKMIALKGQF